MSVDQNKQGLKFTIEPHYDGHGNLYFSAFNSDGTRVTSDNTQNRDACINALDNGVNYTVSK